MADAEPTPLAKLEELTTLLGVAPEHPGAPIALRLASDRFRGAVGHHVSKVEDDEVVLDVDGSRVLLLPAAPVTDVATVEVNGTVVPDIEWSAAGIVRLPGRFPDRLRGVRVVYTHGYDPVPGDVQDAVLEQAQEIFHRVPGLSSMQVGGQTVTFQGARSTTVGVSARWSETVERYGVNGGDRP